MTAYAESAVCRRIQLLHYFGETYEKNCGFCDNCLKPREQYEGQEFVSKVLEAAEQTEERFGLNHLVDVVRGIESQYVKSYKHSNLNVFGSGSDETEMFWKSVVRQTLLLSCWQRILKMWAC